MINAISLATKVKAVAGWTSVSNPNNKYAVPIISSTLIILGGTIVALYKCAKTVYLDIKERIDYHHEKSQTENQEKR